MAVEQQTAGLRGAEIKGDRAGLLGIPAREGDVSSRRVKADRVQSGHVLAAEGQITMHGDLRVMQLSETGELQPELVIRVHHLGEKESEMGVERY